MKKNIFTSLTFLSETTFKEKRHIMSSGTRSLPKPKPSKNGKKNGIGYNFQRKKRCSVLSARNTKKNWKNAGLIEAFIQGSDNFKTFDLPDRDKSKMHVQVINEGNYIESTKRAEQYRPTPLSLSVPKNASILKGFNRMQGTEKVDKTVWSGLLNCVKRKAIFRLQFAFETWEKSGEKFLEKYEHRNSCREFIDYFSDYLFNKDVKNKLLRTNFIGVLNDGTTDTAIIEQVIYVTFLDPGNFF